MSNCPGDWVTISTPYLTPRAEGQRDAWTDEAEQRGRSGTQVLREVTEVVPPDDVAGALRLTTGETAVLRRRTMFLDDQPVETVKSYFPSTVARGTALAESQKIRGGATTLLAALGFLAAEAREDITFKPATDEDAAELQLPAGVPVIVLTRTVYAADGTPFEASVMTMVAEGRRLRYQIKMG